jgi:hypothetical protein
MKRPPTLKEIKTFQRADKVPDGWFSRKMLEREWNLSREYVGKLIQSAVVSRRCRMKKFRIDTGTRGLYPTPHYKFK